MRPEVSVIIPVHNRAVIVLNAIASVLEQTEVSFELVVVDDGSKEDLSEARRIVTSAGHTFLRTKMGGVSAARNLGVKRSNAPLIAFLDSDDRWLPRKLEKQLDFMKTHRDLRISHTEEKWIRDGVCVNPKNRHKKAVGWDFERSLGLCLISPSAVMMERSLFEEHGGFDTRMRVCEDYDLWLRILTGERVGFLDLVLVEKYAGSEDQLSRSELAMDRFRVFSLLKLFLGECLKADFLRPLLCELAKKASIVRKGAAKRGCRKWLYLYGEIEKEAMRQRDEYCERGSVDLENLESLLPEVLEDISSPSPAHCVKARA